MTEEIRQIAQRVKAMREIENLTPATLSAELGVDPAVYEGYEAGRTDIPVGFLMRFAERFGLELSSLLSGAEPKLHVYSVVRKGKGLGVERRKDYRYQSLAPEFAHKRAEPFLVRVDPKPEGDPMSLNSHEGQEYNYLLEGRMLVAVDGHELTLEEGDSLYFDAMKPHGMRALGGKAASFIAVIVK